MPYPDKSLSTLRPDLAGGFMEFDAAMDRLGFIAMKVLPVLEVALAGDSFGKITVESLLRDVDTKRSASGDYSRDDWDFTDDSFATVEHGHEGPIDDNEARRYANYFDLEQVTADRVMDVVLRAQEKRVADLIFNTSTWTGSTLTTAITTAWTKANYTTAVPVDDIEAAVRKVWTLTGQWPNTLIVGKHTFRNLRLCDQVIDRIASAGAGNPTKAADITPAMLAQVFDLDQVLVAGGARNSAIEGQTASITALWSNDDVMVAKVAKTNDLREPCIGRTFHWSADGSQIGGAVETYRDERVRGDVVRVRHQTHEKVLYKELAHLLTNANGGSAT